MEILPKRPARASALLGVWAYHRSVDNVPGYQSQDKDSCFIYSHPNKKFTCNLDLAVKFFDHM